MGKIFKILAINLFSLLVVFITSCTAVNPDDAETSMDPNMKIFLIVICSVFVAGMIGYGIYFYIKQRKDKKKDIEENKE